MAQFPIVKVSLENGKRKRWVGGVVESKMPRPVFIGNHGCWRPECGFDSNWRLSDQMSVAHNLVAPVVESNHLWAVAANVP